MKGATKLRGIYFAPNPLYKMNRRHRIGNICECISITDKGRVKRDHHPQGTGVVVVSPPDGGSSGKAQWLSLDTFRREGKNPLGKYSEESVLSSEQLSSTREP